MKADLTIKVTRDKDCEDIHRSLIIQFPEGKEVVSISSIEYKHLLQRGVEVHTHNLLAFSSSGGTIEEMVKATQEMFNTSNNEKKQNDE